MTLALIALILFLLAPILIGPALAWLRIRDEQASGDRAGPGLQPVRSRGRSALPPAA